jgi:hypothetical protein
MICSRGLDILAKQQTADIKEINNQGIKSIRWSALIALWLRQPEFTTIGLTWRMLLQPTLTAPIDAAFEGRCLFGEIILHQQVLGHRDQQPISRITEAGFEQSVNAFFLTPDGAEHQDPFWRCLPDLRQDLGITGSDFQEDLIWRPPKLAFSNDLQEQRIGFIGVILDFFGSWIGASARDHDRFIAIEQEGRSNVLASQG